MTDTILSPSGVESYMARVVAVPGLGVVAPIGSLTPAEVQELRDDVQAVLNQNLGDLANVSEAGKIEGMGLAVLADGTWGARNLSGAIARVSQNWAPITEVNDVSWLIFGQGLSVAVGSESDRALVNLVFGTSSTTPARGNHTHPPTLKSKVPFNMAGSVLSAGESLLVDYTVTGLISSVTYDVNILGTLEAVNTSLSGRLNLRTQIAANPEQTISRGFSGGVWTEASIMGTHMGITGVTSLRLRFWADYLNGDPTALYSGELGWNISPRGGQP